MREKTEEEIKRLQEKHRMEAIAARNRVKERKARTRRLIQMGAILESAMPQTASMELEELTTFLREQVRTNQ